MPKSESIRKESGPVYVELFFVTVIVLTQVIAIYYEASEFQIIRERSGELLLNVRLFYILYCVMFFLVVATQRKRLKASMIQYLPILLVIPSFVSSWISHIEYSRTQIPFVPFIGYKILCLLLSLSPTNNIFPTVVVILGFAIEAIVLWFFGGVRYLSSPISAEPWITLIFAFASILILIFQNAYRDLNRQCGEMAIRQNVLEDLTKLSMVIRDKINTPLQALELYFECLPKDNQARAARKSLEEIIKMTHPLKEFEPLIDWQQKRFPSEEEVIQQLRKNLQKSEIKFRISSKNHGGSA